MDRLVRRVFTVAAIITTLGVLGFAARAVSTSLAKPPVPPVIAVVDLQAVVAGLDERTNKDAEFQNKGKELQGALDKKKKDWEDTKSQVEATTDKIQRLNLQKKAYLQEQELKFETEFSQQQLDLLYGDLLRDLHGKITVAVTKLAKQNGYTMVLASDEAASIPSGGRTEVTRAIGMKRMLYVEDSHDITQEVITLMNNEFVAGGGKRIDPPPAPPAGNK